MFYESVISSVKFCEKIDGIIGAFFSVLAVGNFLQQEGKWNYCTISFEQRDGVEFFCGIFLFVSEESVCV